MQPYLEKHPDDHLVLFALHAHATDLQGGLVVLIADSGISPCLQKEANNVAVAEEGRSVKRRVAT